MQDSLLLGSTQIARMLEILVAEQARLRHHTLGYRLQKGVSYFLAFALLVWVVGIVAARFIEGIGSGVAFAGMIGSGIASVVLVPLFLWNLPLAWKLFKQRRRRRQLGLQQSLREHFKAAGKKRWIMILLSLVYGVAALGAIGIMIEAIRAREHAPFIDLIETLAANIAVFLVGLSIPSLWLMSREMDRLEEVSRLRDRLVSDVSPEASPAGPVQVLVSDYDSVAQLEKMRVLAERERSIQEAVGLGKSVIYAVQWTDEARAATERLDPEARLRVDEAIFGLMRKPTPKESREVSRDRLSLPVPDSPLALTYEVDRESERIRIHEVDIEGPRSVPESGRSVT